MKRKKLFVVLLLFLFATCIHSVASAQEGTDAISAVKLKAAALLPGMSIAGELRASAQQMFEVRMRIGFPLKALLSQVMLYDGSRARVSYLQMPTKEWHEFGYSKLIEISGDRCLVLTKEGVLIQIVGATQEMERKIVDVLEPDILQAHKIRASQKSLDWKIIHEKLLSSQELLDLNQNAGGGIKEGVWQELMFGHEKINVGYYNCITSRMGEHVAQYFADRTNPLVKRMVRASGQVVVVVDSQEAEVNQHIGALINWQQKSGP